MNLIIIYGDFNNQISDKRQSIIDEKITCGYREYARNFGSIVYLGPCNIRHDWEIKCQTKDELYAYLNSKPESIIWSVKRGNIKDSVLKNYNNTMYYSCNASNIFNPNCKISLVDCESRVVNNRCKLWFKGKDSYFWSGEGSHSDFDYLLMGRRADKNEFYFLDKLSYIKEKRKILWLGGIDHKDKIKTHHNVTYTPMLGPMEVSKKISSAKVGILFTEHPMEGFPQTFIEMTMCGVPVVYNASAPLNKYYISNNVNVLLCKKNNLIEASEEMLKIADHNSCRNFAIKNYSIQKSYENLINIMEK